LEAGVCIAPLSGQDQDEARRKKDSQHPLGNHPEKTRHYPKPFAKASERTVALSTKTEFLTGNSRAGSAVSAKSPLRQRFSPSNQ
jgi:hypothetical protein